MDFNFSTGGWSPYCLPFSPGADLPLNAAPSWPSPGQCLQALMDPPDNVAREHDTLVDLLLKEDFGPVLLPDSPPSRATPQDICAALDGLWLTCDGPCSAAQLSHALLGKGRIIGRTRSRAYLAMAWPVTRPELIGLAEFIASIQASCSADPQLFEDVARLAAAFDKACTQAIDPIRLRAFLLCNMEDVTAFLGMRCVGRAPSAQTVDGLRLACLANRFSTTEQLVVAHEASVMDVVAAWGRRGLPAHWWSLYNLLDRSGVTLHYTDLGKICRLLPGIEHVGPNIFLKGEKPLRARNFLWSSERARQFRGGEPDADREIPEDPPPSAHGGLCHALLKTHPHGFTRQQAIALMGQVAPGLNEAQCSKAIWRSRQSQLLVEVCQGLLSVNPELLCSSRAKQLRLDLPQAQPQHEAAPEPLPPVSRARPSAPLPKDGRAGRIFEVLDQLARAGRLETVVMADSAGERHFHPGLLSNHVRALHPDISVAWINGTVLGMCPEDLSEVLQRQQWTKPSPDATELAGMLQRLGAERPFLCFLSRPRISAMLNEANPDFFVTSDCVGNFVKAQERDMARAEGLLAELVDDGRISLFYKKPESGEDASPDTNSLKLHMALNHVGCSANDLRDLLSKCAAHLRFSRAQFRSPNIVCGARMRLNAIARLEKQPMPPGEDIRRWESFIKVFEQVFCRKRSTRAIRLYSGSMVVRLYLALLRQPTTPAPVVVRQAAKRTREPVEEPQALPAKRRRVCPPVALEKAAALNPIVQPDQGWRDFTRPVVLHLLPTDGRLGMPSLYASLRNMFQDPLSCHLPDHLVDCSAVVRDALTMPLAMPGQSYTRRTTPDGQPLVELSMQAPELTALASMLFTGLDAAVVLKRSAGRNPVGQGEFAAVRRSAGKLVYLGLAPGPVSLHEEQIVPWLSDAEGRFEAALPSVACHGPVGRHVSYVQIDGFRPACDTLQAVLGGVLPLQSFAEWLDIPLPLDARMRHDERDAIRKQAYPEIDLTHLAGFLHGRSTLRWQPVADLPDLCLPEDRAAFLGAVRLHAESLKAHGIALLKMPGNPGITALTRRNGRVHGNVGMLPVSWSKLESSLPAHWPPGQRRRAALFMPQG